MYLEENNFFLLLVYQKCSNCNWTFLANEQYHYTRSKIVKLYGRKIMQEVERIAAFKHKVILTNQENLKKSIDNKTFHN